MEILEANYKPWDISKGGMMIQKNKTAFMIQIECVKRDRPEDWLVCSIELNQNFERVCTIGILHQSMMSTLMMVIQR